MNNGIMSALELLPLHISQALNNEDYLFEIDEIRLRLNKPISLSVLGKNVILPVTVDEQDIEAVFKTSFSYSLHSYSKELSSGYITTKGGNRVGICGTAVTSHSNNSNVETIKYISSINVRISREILGCSDKVIKSCKLPCGILIIGPPSSGKTTLLRDISRSVGNTYKVSLIDEHNEISATFKNKCYCDVGALTDVFVGYPKHIGITTAIKVMSPDFVIVDEIGTKDDLEALDYAISSGANLITAIHSTCLEEAINRRGIKSLIDIGAFNYCVELMPYSKNQHCYKVIKLD